MRRPPIFLLLLLSLSSLRAQQNARNTSIGAKILLTAIKPGAQQRLAKEPEMFPYNAGEIARGADRVRGLYISEGFLDVVVDAAKIDLTENDTRASVTVRIEVRQRYLFGDVQFHGDSMFTRDEL